MQDYRAYAPNAAPGIALREVPLKEGRCDYLLMLDRAAVGIIEAKKEGVLLCGVKSRVYFEQMKSHGTRVLLPTDLQAVSGAEAHAKTHFVIVDAVGICESSKTDSRPWRRSPA